MDTFAFCDFVNSAKAVYNRNKYSVFLYETWVPNIFCKRVQFFKETMLFHTMSLPFPG